MLKHFSLPYLKTGESLYLFENSLKATTLGQQGISAPSHALKFHCHMYLY